MDNSRRPADQRTALCDALSSVEAAAPTLCEGWTAHDLAAHIWSRENQSWQVAPRLLLGRGDQVEDLRRRVAAEHSYAELIERISRGPAGLSPFRLPGVEKAANTMEFFIHCEDVRRGGGDLSSRPIDLAVEDQLWGRLGQLGRLMTRKAPMAVWLRRPGIGEPLRFGKGPEIVTISGQPSECLLYLSGRQQAANVRLIGEARSVERLNQAHLGM